LRSNLQQRAWLLSQLLWFSGNFWQPHRNAFIGWQNWFPHSALVAAVAWSPQGYCNLTSAVTSFLGSGRSSLKCTCTHLRPLHHHHKSVSLHGLDGKNFRYSVVTPDYIFLLQVYGSVSKPCTPVVHIKIAGKWMFIPLRMVLIGIDP
jgi:hypothetical protein